MLKLKFEAKLDFQIESINSVVDLKLRKAGDGKEEYEVVNGGNVPLDVEVYHNDILNQTLVLGIDEGEKVSGEAFVGRQYG